MKKFIKLATVCMAASMFAATGCFANTGRNPAQPSDSDIIISAGSSQAGAPEGLAVSSDPNSAASSSEQNGSDASLSESGSPNNAENDGSRNESAAATEETATATPTPDPAKKQKLSAYKAYKKILDKNSKNIKWFEQRAKKDKQISGPCCGLYDLNNDGVEELYFMLRNKKYGPTPLADFYVYTYDANDNKAVKALCVETIYADEVQIPPSSAVCILNDGTFMVRRTYGEDISNTDKITIYKINGTKAGKIKTFQKTEHYSYETNKETYSYKIDGKKTNSKQYKSAYDDCYDKVDKHLLINRFSSKSSGAKGYSNYADTMDQIKKLIGDSDDSGANSSGETTAAESREPGEVSGSLTDSLTDGAGSSNDSSTSRKSVDITKLCTGVKASSVAKSEGSNTYKAQNVLDGKTSTAWVEGVSGTGVGENLVFEFPEGTTITGIKIHTGYCKSDIVFNRNGAPTACTISSGDKSFSFDLNTKDYDYAAKILSVSKKGVNVKFDTPIVSDGKVVLTIDSVRDGSKWSDTCISEISFKGYQ